MSKFNKILPSLCVFVLIVFSLFFSFFLLETDLFNVADNDVLSRLMGVYKYRGIQSINFNSIWLPFYKLIYGSIQMLVSSSLTPFYINIFLSSTSVGAIYLFSKSFFKDRGISILSSLIFLFFPLRILLSILPLTETAFSCLLVLVAYFLLNLKRNHYVFFYSLVVFFASGLRFEAWYLSPIFILIIFCLDISVQKKIIATISTILFPMLYLFFNYFTKGNPLYFLGKKLFYASLADPKTYFSISYSVGGWSRQLISVYPVVFIILYFLGIVLTWKNNNFVKRLLSLIPFYLFTMLVIQVYLGTMEWFPARYLFPVVILTFPFIAYSLIWVIKFILKMKAKIGFTKLFVIALMGIYLTLLLKIEKTRRVFYCDDNCSRYYMYELILEKKSTSVVPYITLEGEGLWIYNDGFAYYNRPQEFSNDFKIVAQPRNEKYCEENLVVVEINAVSTICDQYALIYEDSEGFLNIYSK